MCLEPRQKGIGNVKHLETVAQAAADRYDGLPDDAQAPLRARGTPRHLPKTTVPAHSGRPGHTPPVASRALAALQAVTAPRDSEGGPRADLSSDASTLSVAGGRTSARRTMTLPHVGQARPLTPNTRHNSTLHGVHLELPVPAFVNRIPTPSGATLRFGGIGRTARCHRCRDASTPP